MKKFLNILLNVVLGIFLLIGVLVLFSVLPIKGNYKILTVMSGSMAPKIKTGSLIVVRPASDYSQGEIITFYSPDAKKTKETTTHRIVEIKERDGQKFYLAKGDANDVADKKEIIKEQIVGKYIFGIPYLGYLVGYIKTLPGLVLIVIVPATIIIYGEAKNIKKEIKKIRRKKAKEQAFKSREAK